MFAAGPEREVGEPQSLVMAGDTIIEDTGVFRIAYMLVLVMMVCNRRSEVRGEHVGGVRLAKDDEVSFMIASIAYCVHSAQGT